MLHHVIRRKEFANVSEKIIRSTHKLFEKCTIRELSIGMRLTVARRNISYESDDVATLKNIYSSPFDMIP